MSFYKGCAGSAVAGMRNAVPLGIYFYDVGAAVMIVVIVASIYIAFYTMVVGMHFIALEIVAHDVFVHKLYLLDFLGISEIRSINADVFIFCKIILLIPALFYIRKKNIN